MGVDPTKFGRKSTPLVSVIHSARWKSALYVVADLCFVIASLQRIICVVTTVFMIYCRLGFYNL